MLKKGPTRVNDPVYLSYVRTWYAQIAQQLKGLLWKDGGPVIGIQLENEYSQRGPDARRSTHPRVEKDRHREAASMFPFTCYWMGQCRRPARAVLPVYGGYPDAPWDTSTSKLPPSEVYAFRFQSRVTANMGAIGGSRQNGNAESITQDLCLP